MAALESILCFSPFPWGSGQRPQHLLSQCTRERRLVYFEDPVYDAAAPRLALSHTDDGVLLAVPHLPPNTSRARAEAALRRMVDRVLTELGETRPVLWYCTPMAVGFTDHLEASAIVYDCTEAPRRGRISPAEWADRERWLFERADVIFTDSHSLCRHTRQTARRNNVFPFMSSVDVDYFGAAREQLIEPADQDEIPRPRVGFCGVIDERVDLQLLDHLASTRPDLQFVMVGPIVGLDPTTLPQGPNLHWLGAKPQTQLPAYIAGWDVAMLPLVCNDVTQFMSPRTAAELLAAGKPVVATPIPDVVEPFGRDGLAWIAEDFGEFADAIDEALSSDRYARVIHADAYLADHSWRATWNDMWIYVERAAASRTTTRKDKARRPKPVSVSRSVSTAAPR